MIISMPPRKKTKEDDPERHKDTITVRVGIDTKRRLRAAAKQEGRSVNNWFEFHALESIESLLNQVLKQQKH